MNKSELISAIGGNQRTHQEGRWCGAGGVHHRRRGRAQSWRQGAARRLWRLEVKARAARIGKNPRTSEAVKIAASKAPVFKAGKALKDALN